MKQIQLPFDQSVAREERFANEPRTVPPSPSPRPSPAPSPSPRDPAIDRLRTIFRRLYGNWTQEEVPPVRIEFYPYTSLRHTLRRREGVLTARLSDLLRTAPEEIQEAILAILICKLLRRRTPQRYARRYLEWAALPAVRTAAKRVRAARGRKELTSPAGRIFDLSVIYERLNRQYFDGDLKVRHLSWSRRKARRRLGHYDPAHRAIVINRRLDHPLVPEYVVEFIVYHEMLHAKLGERCRNGRLHFHHPEFREAERRFHDFERAERFVNEELP